VIHRAALKRQRLLVPFRDAKVSHFVARFLPGLYERMMVRRIVPE
jgi:hypothetical protein